MALHLITSIFTGFSFPGIGDGNAFELLSNTLYVAFGGLITYLTVRSSERIRQKKEKQSEKQAVYFEMCAALITYIRQANNYLTIKTRMHFFYQNFQISKNENTQTELYKEQYLLLVGKMLDTKSVRSESANFIDTCMVKYYTIVGEDPGIDALLYEFKFVEKPKTSVFKGITDGAELLGALNEKLAGLASFRKKMRANGLNKIKTHMKSKLKI